MITAQSGEDKYFTQLSNGTAMIYADTTGDKGGSGNYFRPHDLLCAGLSSCLNITVRMILERMALKYEKVITNVDLNRQENSTTFLYHIDIVGDIDDATKDRIIAEVSNCPVRKTLSQKIDFEWIDAG
jgi:putative redox protein